ncbi:MAG: radical SAM protein [Verrucomicrobia bacterium]|nr:radical SAM protein [Verrucomicrobiota bacterium]
MKASAYNLWIPAKRPSGHEQVLFNTLYGSMTAFDGNEVEAVKAIMQTSRREKALAPFFAILKKQKHLIADDVNEISIIENRRRRGILDRNRLDVIIMPTLWCNFACKYCYEKPLAFSMDAVTEMAIRVWLEREIPRHKVLMLSWFGGEPMLELGRVLSISRFARETAALHGVEAVIHMTTNGYLLDLKRAQALFDVGVDDFQITLDGNRQCHDRMRIRRDGSPTFDTITKNIIGLAGVSALVRITLRVNFNHENIESVPALLELFPRSIRPQLRLALEPIFGDCALSALGNLDPAVISEATTRIYRQAADMGYKVTVASSQSTEGKLVYCYAERRNQAIINFNGDVYKCSVCEFRPEDRVGFLRADGTLVREKSWAQWVDERPFSDECKACKFLPLCMGGCRKARLRQDDGGTICALVPTNTTEVLKRVAWGDLGAMIA